MEREEDFVFVVDSNVVVVAEKDDVAPLNRLAPAARSLFLESPFSARECFRETRISAFELKFK